MIRIFAILFMLGSTPADASSLALVCKISTADGKDMDIPMSLDIANQTLSGGGEMAKLVDQTTDLLFFRSRAEMNGVYRVNEVVIHRKDRRIWISNFTAKNGFFTADGICTTASGD
ncbi:MAG: hypothetical protein GQ539_02275 [Sulfitobacter sp.]|nr:hypothetical protein [Sulfitobacter sp.]